MFVFNVYSNSRLIHAGIPVNEKITIGRDPCNDLLVPEPSVSRRHLALRLERIGEREVVVITDEGSCNGTYVNTQRIKEKAVCPGDLVRFGCCRLEVLGVETGVGRAHSRNAGDETVVYRLDPLADDPSSAARMRALYSMALCLADLEIPFMLEKAAEIARTSVDFDQFSFFLEGKKDLVLCTSWDRNGPCGHEEIIPDWNVIRSCIQLARPLVSSARKDRKSREESALTITSAVSVPLRAEGRNLGVLFCTTFGPERRFTEEDLHFLTLVACFVASGISHRRNLADVQMTTAKLEAILGSLQEGVVVCDPEFRILSANHAAREIFALPSLLGLGMEEALDGFVHTYDYHHVNLSRAFDMERRKPQHRPDGPPEIEAYRATVSSTAGLDSEGWLRIVCIRDVTQERRSELAQLAFVNRLGHKLRTPLTVLSGTTSLLSARLTESADGETQELIVLAEKSCEQMATLIDNFVEFTTLAQQKSQLRSCQIAVSMRFLVDEALNLSRDDIEESGLLIARELPEEDHQVVVIPDKVCQCFIQLVRNACKFAGKGATLTVRVYKKDGLVVQFIDDGPGIPKDCLKKVFDVFHQIDREGTGEVPGVGLGLWWTREMVKIHGGEIRITSPVVGGLGTSVKITFPLRLLVTPGGQRLDETVEYPHFDPHLEMVDW